MISFMSPCQFWYNEGMKKSLLVFGVSLLTATALMTGCAGSKTAAPARTIEDITTQEAFDLIQENEGNADFVILDVRTAGEFAEGHIENALNIDYYSETFEDELNQLDKTKTYLAYCRSGGRSRSAVDIMEEPNFREIYHMPGGIIQWQAEELPTTK